MSLNNLSSFRNINNFNKRQTHNHNKRIKSLIFNQDLENTLRKKSLLSKHRTYFESQIQSKIRSDVENHQYFKDYLISIIYQAVHISTQHWKFVNSLSNYLQQTYQKAYKHTDLQKPNIGDNQLNLKEQKEPKNINVSLKLQINKFQRITLKSHYYHNSQDISNCNSNSSIQDQRNSSINTSLKLDFRYYKKIHQKQKLKISRQKQNSLFLLDSQKKFQQQENQSSSASQMRTSRLAIQYIKKRNQGRNLALSGFKKGAFVDKGDKKYLNRSHNKAGTLFGANNGKLKDFAFDSNGGFIKLKKKSQNIRFQKDEYFLDISMTNSLHHQLSNFVKLSVDKIRPQLTRRQNESFRQDNIKVQNAIDGLKYRQNFMKSLHLKQGVLLKQKSGKIGYESTHTQTKLPRI